MKYFGGTISTPIEPEEVVKAKDIKTSVTIVTLKGAEFTLHRVDESVPAKFFKTFVRQTAIPIIEAPNDKYEEPYAVFTIPCGELVQGALTQLMARDGSTETYIVKSFVVNPPDTNRNSCFARGKQGFGRKTQRQVQCSA